MDTKTDIEPRLPVIALAAIFLAVAVATLAGPRMPQGNDVADIPSDVRSLATEMTPVGAEGKIPAADAIASFEREMGAWHGAEISTYLVRMTSPELANLKDREVWVLRYSGVDVPYSIPNPPDGVEQTWPDGTPTAGTVLYAFVDAKTGEWLAATNGTR